MPANVPPTAQCVRQLVASRLTPACFCRTPRALRHSPWEGAAMRAGLPPKSATCNGCQARAHRAELPASLTMQACAYALRSWSAHATCWQQINTSITSHATVLYTPQSSQHATRRRTNKLYRMTPWQHCCHNHQQQQRPTTAGNINAQHRLLTTSRIIPVMSM